MIEKLIKTGLIVIAITAIVFGGYMVLKPETASASNQVNAADSGEISRRGGNGNSRTGNEAVGQGSAAANRRSGKGGSSQGTGTTQSPLDETEIEALNLAIQDEYRALTIYQTVMDTFGDVYPFNSIAQSEQKHIAALEHMFEKYDLEIPANEWYGNVPVFESVSAACEAGVEAEIDNAGLYDQLFSMTDNQDLTQIFTNLSRASLNSHLPMFESCSP